MSHGLLAGKGPASTGMHSIGEARSAAVEGHRGRDRSARGRNEGRSGGSGEGLLLGPGLPVGTRRTLQGQTATQAAHAVTTLNGTAGRLTPCVSHFTATAQRRESWHGLLRRTLSWGAWGGASRRCHLSQVDANLHRLNKNSNQRKKSTA